MIREVVTPDRFREVIGHFTSGVTVISTVIDDNVFATTASAVSSLSDDPPMLLACMNRRSDTGAAIAENGRFAVNVLGSEQHTLARQLARKGPAKLIGVELCDGATRLPVLADALATLECTVVDRAEAATHVVYLAEVDAVLHRPGAPLVYYRGRFAHLGDEIS